MITAIENFSQIETILPTYKYSNAFAIIDLEVGKGHLDLIKVLKKLKVETIELKNDTELKTIAGFELLLEKIFKFEIDKDTILIAVGGGQLTDLVGFAASVILRGLRWISVPTTFLGMIDAGIGGKTAIDTKFGKNLIGTFHLPLVSIIYANFLRTLAEAETSSGCGELIKYALLSPEIETLIVNRAANSEVILQCARFKSEIVMRDPLDQGERKYLNLGHTLGHGFEYYFKIPHGIAVFWGLYWEHLAMGEVKTAARTLDLAGRLGFPIKSKINLLQLDAIWPFVAKDKKKKDLKNLILPLVKDNGEKAQLTISLDSFYEALAKLRDSTLSQ
jgi:3-dehydroquinate synthetase